MHRCHRSANLSGLVIALLLASPGARSAAAAPEAGQQLLNLPLSDLLELDVSTASIRPEPPREQPGAVTVLTTKDMAAAGARTLQDALLLVPGMSQGIDVFNVTGLVFRGTWAYEGKILFLIDDIPVNDLLFGIYTMPPNFPVELLDRIEVLRGPGGAKYGENAELAVVRIYTRNSGHHGGMAALTTAVQADGSPLRQLSASDQWTGASGSLALLGTVSDGNWGTGTWTDALGSRYDTANQNKQSGQWSLDSRWRGNHVQLYVEQFTLDGVQRYGTLTPDQDIEFHNSNLRWEHAFKLDSGLILTPSWTYRDEDVWHGTSLALPSFYELPAQRNTVELEALRAFNNGISVRAGAQAYWTSAYAAALVVPEFAGKTAANYFQGHNSVSYHSSSYYAESELPWGRYKLSLGVRAADYSAAGNATVPRLALTRSEPNWHFKALFDSAYREPQIETVNESTGPLRAERTTLAELEGGHALGAHQYLTASVFQYELRDAIVFSTAANGAIGYNNNPPYRGQGAELQWRWQYGNWRMDANYEHSRTDDNAISVYTVNSTSNQSLGAPSDIFNLWLSYQLTPSWTLSPRLRYQSAMTAYVFDPLSTASPPLSQATLAAEWTLNLTARYYHWPWTLDLGLRNVGDTTLLLPEPYAGTSPPYPYGARELWARLKYEF